MSLQFSSRAVERADRADHERQRDDGTALQQPALGAQAGASGGPVGRQTAAETDWKMRAEVLSYSRSRGVFARGYAGTRDNETG